MFFVVLKCRLPGGLFICAGPLAMMMLSVSHTLLNGAATTASCDDTPSLHIPLSLGKSLLQAASSASTVLGTTDPFEGRPLAGLNAAVAMSTLFYNADHPSFFLGGQAKERKESSMTLRQSVLRDIQDHFELADAAYLLGDHKSLKGKLHAAGYNLLVHEDGTAPGRIAYFIALSSATKEVVISLKGTSASADVLTDLVCKSVPLTLPSGHQAHVHEGMSSAAETIYKEIKDLLEKLVYPMKYTVTVTGHSLGAGSAALLGLMLREHASWR